MTDDLTTSHQDEMLIDPTVEIMSTTTFDEAGDNETLFVFNNPTQKNIIGGHLLIGFATPEGELVAQRALTLTLEAGPSVIPVVWNTSEFSPTYQTDQDYKMVAYVTDWTGVIIDTDLRYLSDLKPDPRPIFATDEAALTWDFGTAIQGEVLNHRIPLANIGFRDLLTYAYESVSAARRWVAFTNANYVREIAIEGDNLWAAAIPAPSQIA